MKHFIYIARLLFFNLLFKSSQTRLSIVSHSLFLLHQPKPSFKPSRDGIRAADALPLPLLCPDIFVSPPEHHGPHVLLLVRG